MIDLDALEELAKKATPGEWDAYGLEIRDYTPAGVRANRRLLCDVHPPTRQDETGQQGRDAAFIAAANPTIILELIARMRSSASFLLACAHEEARFESLVDQIQAVGIDIDKTHERSYEAGYSAAITDVVRWLREKEPMTVWVAVVVGFACGVVTILVGELAKRLW